MVANDSQVMRVVGRVSLRACKMRLSRDTLEKMICQLFEAKVARNFFTIMLVLKVGHLLKSLLLLCSCWAKSNQQPVSAVETCSSGEICKFVYVLLATCSILLEYLYTLLRLL
jgi:hypothetical protein